MKRFEFDHVVLTRFNLATAGREERLRRAPDWLSSRFDLFEKYCLPSLARQTCQDFQWLIYFDIETPDSARRRIEACQGVRPFQAVFTPMFPGEDWIRIVRENARIEAPYILTTNLDNDDALASDYVERLHAAVQLEGAVPRCINFRNGLVLTENALFSHSHESNAFTNLLEISDDRAATAPGVKHMEAGERFVMQQVLGHPAWLQVVHGNNVSNRARGVRISSDAALKLFDPTLFQNVVAPSTADRVIDGFVVAPLRAMRDRGVKLARKVVKSLGLRGR